MEVRIELARALRRQPRYRLQLLARGRDDAFGRAEVREQRALARRADAGELVEQRRRHRAVATRAVMRDREAVRLVAYALQQLQLRGRVVEHERRAAPGDEQLLDPLRQRDDRDAALAKAGPRTEPGRELALAAVDYDYVRQRCEARVIRRIVRREVGLALPLGEAAREHLGHRREIVRGALLERADLEAPVVGLLRRAALEDDHRRDRLRPAEVRDVEALDADRRRIEAERLLQSFDGLDAALAAPLRAQPLLVEREVRVAPGELEDPALLATLGRAQLD